MSDVDDNEFAPPASLDEFTCEFGGDDERYNGEYSEDDGSLFEPLP